MDTAANIAVMAKILVFFNLDINIPPLQYLPFYYIGGHLTCVAAGCDKETARTTFRPDDNSPFIEHLTPLCLLCICLFQIIMHVFKNCNKKDGKFPSVGLVKELVFFEVSLWMCTCRTCLWSFFSFNNITAVITFP